MEETIDRKTEDLFNILLIKRVIVCRTRSNPVSNYIARNKYRLFHRT